MPLLADVNPNDLSVSSSSNKKRPAEDSVSSGAIQKKPATDWAKLTVTELKEHCAKKGLRKGGKKAELIARLENPAAAAASMNTRTVEGVHAALRASGYLHPTRASKCACKALQKGRLSLEKGLDAIVFSGKCMECSKTLPCTLRALLDQPDYGGNEYEDGAENGALHCEDCESGYYVTGICTGNLSVDSGKFHNHCGECPGFGMCIGDYREAHCSGCNKHFFLGLSGFGCPNCSPDDVESDYFY